jgi:hypothetical protein
VYFAYGEDVVLLNRQGSWCRSGLLVASSAGMHCTGSALYGGCEMHLAADSSCNKLSWGGAWHLTSGASGVHAFLVWATHMPVPIG